MYNIEVEQINVSGQITILIWVNYVRCTVWV